MSELNFDQEKLLETYKPDFALGYGSGIVKQAGYSEQDKPMLDFIFGVESTKNWHQANLRNNPKDYSLIARLMGIKFIEYLQTKGAQIYYNPFVPFDGQSIKYGVIQLDDLIKDLNDWTTLYTAGRLHKPVEIFQSHPEVMHAVNKNYENAFRTALLLLPENFTEEDLYMTIAGLSYTGDSRMGIGENPQKVRNIVAQNIEGFRALYKGLIEANPTIVTNLNEGKLQQNIDSQIQSVLFAQLPANLKNSAEKNKDNNTRDELRVVLNRAIAKIVNQPTKAQTIKGIFSAGPVKAIKYGWQKLKKARKK